MNRRKRAVARLVAGLGVVTILAHCVSCGGSESGQTAALAPPAAPVEELLRRADEAYAARPNLGRLREGLKALRQIRAVAHDNYEAAWRAARLNYTLGDDSDDEKESAQAFTDGIEAGEAAVRAEPNKPEGHFWLGANNGGLAEAKGILYGVSGTQKLRSEMETVLRLDEGFQGGSAYMVLGRLDLELPGMLGGDPQRAVQTLEKGLRYGEQNSLLRLYLAQAYLRVKRKDDARKQLNYILSMKPHSDFLPEHGEAVQKARELLAKTS